MANYSYTFPIGGGNAIITSGFGSRTAPKPGASTFHQGIDIQAKEGTAVLAAFGGTVTQKGTNATSGNYIVVKSTNGIETVYRHLKSFNVNAGTAVREGVKIAESGNTGISTGPHLHFEIRKDGKSVDPQSFAVNTSGADKSSGNDLLGLLKSKWWLLAAALVVVAIIK